MDEMWSKIDDIIIKTIISVEPLLHNGLEMFINKANGNHPHNCFELLGFDVLID